MRILKILIYLTVNAFIVSGCAAPMVAGSGASAAGSGLSAGSALGATAGAIGIVYGAYTLGKMINEYERANEYISVLSHMSTSMDKPKTEPKNFGLYTYVLIGEKPTLTESPCGSNIYTKACKYEKVLHEVQKNNSYAKRKDNEKKKMIGFKKSNYNLFILPSKFMTENVELKTYNYELSFAYLEALNYATNGKYNLLSREGPFLVSLKKPISFKERDAYALYVDLTSAKPEIIEEIITSYKERLQSDKGNKPFSNLETIKADFLKHLVDFNDDVEIILESSN